MRIYVAHATSFDFLAELYAPLKASPAWSQHEFILPHLDPAAPMQNSRDIIKSCDLVLAEVSHPSTGMGIELGWAHAAGVPIIAIYHADARPSSAVKVVARAVLPYQDLTQDLPVLLSN